MHSRCVCDKCGKDVLMDNDAVVFDYVLQLGRLPDDFSILVYGARHLFPTPDCEGSPYRVQYLGGKRDTRGYPYLTSYETEAKEAYRLMLKLIAESE